MKFRYRWLPYLSLAFLMMISCSQKPAEQRTVDITRLVREGKLNEASTEITRALAEYPNDSSLLYNLATIQRLQGNLEDANHTITRALANAPDDDAINYLMVELQIASGNTQEAWDRFQNLSAAFRQQSHAQFTLGIIHSALGNWPNAEGCFRAAMTLPNPIPAAKAALAFVVCKQGRIEEGKAYLLEAETASDGSPDTLSQIAESNLLLGQAQKARELAKKLTDQFPTNARYWSLLGRSEMILLHFPEAESAFTRALASPNATPWTQVQYAEMLFAMHREDEALTQAIDAETRISAMKIPLRNPSIFNLLATLYAKKNQLHLAQSYLNRSYQVNPNQPQVQTLLKKIEDVQNASTAPGTIPETTSTP